MSNLTTSENKDLGLFWVTTPCGYQTGMYFKKELALKDAENYLIWKRNYLRQNPTATL